MKKILVLLVVFAMMFCLSATAFAEGDGSLQKVLDRGVLRVGAEGNWSPYVYNEPDGTLVGFEVEMAAAIAEKLGVGIEENPSDSWDGVLAGLEANRYDVVICGASPNPSRQEAYEVTQPYGEQLIALVVSEKNEDIKEWSDLKGKVSANSLTSSSGNIARNYGAELVEASLEEAMMLVPTARSTMQLQLMRTSQQTQMPVLKLHSIIHRRMPMKFSPLPLSRKVMLSSVMQLTMQFPN